MRVDAAAQHDERTVQDQGDVVDGSTGSDPGSDGEEDEVEEPQH